VSVRYYDAKVGRELLMMVKAFLDAADGVVN